MNLAPGVRRWAIPPLLATALLVFYWPLVAVASLLLGAFVLAFFRDPERTPPPTGVPSPADGRVSVLREEGERVRLGVFMNVWNVHVVRAPYAGTVVDVEHTPGAHRPAFSKDSDRNERVRVTIRARDNVEREVTLIAGAFARRIFPYVEAGDDVARGERIGHIAFGSRVDVLFSPEVEREDVAVSLGEKVRAGESVVLEREPTPADDGTPAEGGE